MAKQKDLVDILAEALAEAEEHLEWCSYGDKWERECARERGLPETIKDALEAYKNMKALKPWTKTNK